MTQERIDGPTPNGGDYSMAYYTNEKWEQVEKELATVVIIQELKNDGTLIMETIGKIGEEE